MYLTHFGRVGDVARLGADLLEQIDAMVRIGRACPPGRNGTRRCVAASPRRTSSGCRRTAARCPRSRRSNCFRDGRRAQRAGPRDLARPGPLDWLRQGVAMGKDTLRFREQGGGGHRAAQGIGAACAERPGGRRRDARAVGRGRHPWHGACPSLAGRGVRALYRHRDVSRRPTSTPRSWQRSTPSAASTRSSTTPASSGGRLPRHHRGRLGCGDRRQPQGLVPRRPGRGAVDGRAEAAARS